MHTYTYTYTHTRHRAPYTGLVRLLLTRRAARAALHVQEPPGRTTARGRGGAAPLLVQLDT